MAINKTFNFTNVYPPGGGGFAYSHQKQMIKNRQNQYKAVVGRSSCNHSRVTKSFFMKDESRPLWHCDICMVELVPVEDSTEASEAQSASDQKN